jgi:MoxR-like ATPase
LTERSRRPVGSGDGRTALRFRPRGPRGPEEGRLPLRRGHRRHRLPRRPPPEADPRRGSGRHGQDPAGQVGCYEGLDESKALYEWNYKKQLLRIQAAGKQDDSGSDEWDALSGDIFSDDFLLTRPLLEAITADDPVVLLIDEVDRVEVETEALLLEILSDYTVSIPELGTIEAKQIPMVFLTSNNTRELSEALKRRCLYLHVDYPDLEREKEIVLTKVPDITESLADQVARIVRSIRNLELKKSPSVSETLDWARTLLLLGVNQIDAETARSTINILLKYQSDITKALRELEDAKSDMAKDTAAAPSS